MKSCNRIWTFKITKLNNNKGIFSTTGVSWRLGHAKLKMNILGLVFYLRFFLIQQQSEHVIYSPLASSPKLSPPWMKLKFFPSVANIFLAMLYLCHTKYLHEFQNFMRTTVPILGNLSLEFYEAINWDLDTSLILKCMSILHIRVR